MSRKSTPQSLTRIALSALAILSLAILASCGRQEQAKRVSLEAKGPEASSQVETVSEKPLYRFGFDLRLSPKEDVRIYSPFLKYLEKSTGKRFVIRFTEKYEDTVDNLGKGITQFAALGPLNAVRAQHRYNVDCLVMGLNESGKPEYRSAVIARMDSDIQSIKDLAGRSFIFGDRYSTQGHLIPRKMLEDEGLTPQRLASFAYSGSHANTARAVLNGQYDAGGIQDALANRLSSDGRVKVIALSKPYPSSLICYGRSVEKETVMAVRNALLALDPQGKDRALLPAWEKTEMPGGFASYDPKALAEIRDLAR